MNQPLTRARWFVQGDIDGFFGLFVDNLLQLMLIATLLPGVCGIPLDFVTTRILPGAALSILLGNLFYAWQARQLAIHTGRPHVTALPYGINTLSLFAHVFLIMGPVYRETQNSDLAWKAGLFACFGSALIEILGALGGDWLRRHTPRAALLTALAGIALTFISMGFVFQIFASPLLAVVPAFFILFVYSSRIKLPGNIPGGFAAVILGTALAWGLRWLGLNFFEPSTQAVSLAWHAPQSSVSELFDFLVHQDGWKYVSIILPMGLFNVIGSLQNLESAEAAGDRFATFSSLLANGLGSLLAAGLGSPFPTTIYIGHPGWKAMGARWGYSVLNGIVITALCLLGGVSLALRWIPIEAMIGILLWIGLIIAAQAYRDVPRLHFLGVAFGFIPTLAAWLLLQIETTLRVVGTDLYSSASKFTGSIFIEGIFALNQGFILTSMIFGAVLVYTTERQWQKAAAWCLAAAGLSWLGLIHAYTLTPLGLQARFGWGMAKGFTAAYLACALLLLALKVFGRVALDPSAVAGRRFFDKRRGTLGDQRRGDGRRQESSQASDDTSAPETGRPRRRRRKRRLVLTLLLLSATVTHADSFYDVGASTTFATFNAALSQVALDQGVSPFTQKIRVRGVTGVYFETIQAPLGLQPQIGNELVIESMPGHSAQIQALGAYAVRISGVANVWIQGLRLRGALVAALSLVSAPNARVTSMNMAGSGSAEIDATGCQALLIQDSVFTPNNTSGVVLDECPDAIISNNQVLKPNLGFASYGLVIQNSPRSQLKNNQVLGASSAYSVFSSANVTLSANVAIVRGGSAGATLDNAPGTLLINNLLVGQDVGVQANASSNCAFYNNTIWEHGTGGLVTAAASSPMLLRNNLLQGFIALFFDDASLLGLNSDQNLLQGSARIAVGNSSAWTALTDWQGSGRDLNSYTGSPQFVAANGSSADDFKIQAGSPALLIGANLSATFSEDYFHNTHPPVTTPWDAGFHSLNALQATLTMSPTPAPILPTLTPSASATPTVTVTPSASPMGTNTYTATPSPSHTITPTFTTTAYAIQKDRVIAYPNPYKPALGALHIVFDPDAEITIRVLDQTGALVTDLAPASIQAGLGHATWDGRSDKGEPVPSGLYFVLVRSSKWSRFSRFAVLH